MKKEDFERLKAKLGDEFTAEYRVEKDVTIVLVSKKKDIWDGVEFVELVHEVGNNMEVGKIYKLGLLNDCGKKIWKEYKLIVPSTEQAYIEQLKKEAHERFGEILDELDFFKSKIDRSNLSGININESNIGFRYFKWPQDSLYFNGLLIYRQGKWATRVKERVEVEMSECVANFGTYQPYTIEAKFTIKNVKDYDHANLPNFLRSQLEKYLNGEIE